MGEQVRYYRGALTDSMIFKERVRRAGALMDEAGLDAILLTKPQNMMYLLGDGRLCAFAIVSKKGTTYYGVPKTDLEDVKKTCASEHILGFEDEVGMLHSLMHIWKELGLEKGTVGVEDTCAEKKKGERDVTVFFCRISDRRLCQAVSVFHRSDRTRSVEARMLELLVVPSAFCPASRLELRRSL